MSDLYYFLAFVAVCVIYYILDVRRKSRSKGESRGDLREVGAASDEGSERKAPRPDDCCGAHEVCEKETLINGRIKADYYDDEELDVFVGRPSDSYSEEEIRQFSEVFYTLKDYDVAGWLKSLQARNLSLPDSLRDEAFLIIQERRYKER